MRNYWFCSCEEGHNITYFLNENQTEADLPSQSCAQGHPFVTVAKRPAADIVQITLRPAAHIDTVSEKVFNENAYYIVLRDFITEKERVSLRCYSWEQITSPTGFLHWFRKANAEKAWRLMDTLDNR